MIFSIAFVASSFRAAQPPAACWRGSLRFDLQPELDQSADGFGAVGLVILRPLVDLVCPRAATNGADGSRPVAVDRAFWFTLIDLAINGFTKIASQGGGMATLSARREGYRSSYPPAPSPVLFATRRNSLAKAL